MRKVLAYDLGTGGVKASLYNEKGESLVNAFVEYKTHYPKPDWHEQRPSDWWEGVIESTNILLRDVGDEVNDIVAISLSGHSLVAVPMGKDGNMLLEQVPIWSDTRAIEEAEEFMSKTDEEEWYLTTGNGFPAPCYSIFKLMWMKKNQPEVFKGIYKVLGSKDYINYKLTGEMYTDHSYASGLGAYDLLAGNLKQEFLETAGLPIEIFPKIIKSSDIIGKLTKESAKELGLSTETVVTCGGVDNSCMSLGAIGADEGKCYTSLGSSSWLAVTSSMPVLDPQLKPYVFAHIEPNKYTSAFSIFSGGSSLRWVRENLCRDLDKEDAYERMSEMAKDIPIGSRGVLFNPSLAGGTSQDKSIHIRGAFVNLSLGNTREEMVRGTMEGIALNLKASLINLKKHTTLAKEILFCGGGSKSPFWMQMFADIFNMSIVKTNVNQEAASLGAAAIAFVGLGIWESYELIPSLHINEGKYNPIIENVESYNHIFSKFTYINEKMSEIGEHLNNLSVE
jgi:xylulokinase